MQTPARINVAVFADAEKEDAVEDALDGFVEFVALDEFGVVVLLVEVGGEFLARLVEEMEELGVGRAGAVGLDDPLPARLALAGRLRRKGVE